jgi:hypothetical protein
MLPSAKSAGWKREILLGLDIGHVGEGAVRRSSAARTRATSQHRRPMADGEATPVRRLRHCRPLLRGVTPLRFTTPAPRGAEPPRDACVGGAPSRSTARRRGLPCGDSRKGEIPQTEERNGKLVTKGSQRDCFASTTRTHRRRAVQTCREANAPRPARSSASSAPRTLPGRLTTS